MTYLYGKIPWTDASEQEIEIMDFSELRNAVVLQAVKDWRTSDHRLSKAPEDKSAKAKKQECERFFRSRWFSFWTGINGEYLLRRLKGENQE